MKLTLVGHTTEPLKNICYAIACMKQSDPVNYVNSLTLGEQRNMVTEIMKTRLRGALEAASFEFVLEDVTRAFTHQLVRHRTFHFSQQSMRFFNASSSGFRMPQTLTSAQKNDIETCVEYVRHTYQGLINSGLPTEDARSILPTNVLTLIGFGANFRGLLEMGEVRLCLQTQAEFREIMQAIRTEIVRVDPFLGELLLPACQRSGECEFKSIFDRPCPLRKEGGDKHESRT
jgi:thymidylate synthase (FAD)